MEYKYKFSIINLILIFTIFFSTASFAVGKVDVALTGDSYAGYFYEFEEDNAYNIDFIKYARAAHTIVDNENFTIDAIKSSYDTVILSIGVNDHFMGTELDVFKDTLDEFFSLADDYGKKMYVHSYMPYPLSKIYNVKYSELDYDKILYDESKKFKNVTYINMLDCQGINFIQADLAHYNKQFYDILFSRIFIEKNDNVKSDIIYAPN